VRLFHVADRCGLDIHPWALRLITQNLKRIEQLPNLKEINAANNMIGQLHKEMLDMFSIETLFLYGNPIVNSNPKLAQIEKN